MNVFRRWFEVVVRTVVLILFMLLMVATALAHRFDVDVIEL